MGFSKVMLSALVATLLSAMMGPAGTPEPAGEAAITMAVHDAFVVEHSAGKGFAAVLIVLSERQDVPATVQVTSADDTATAPEDYTAVDEIVEIAVGQLQLTLEIPVVADDLVEADERFTVTLSDPTGAVLTDGDATVVIVDDDGQGSTPVRVCDDGNPYTTDQYDEGLGRCGFTIVVGADYDDDRAKAAWVGGPDCDDSSNTVAPRFADVPGDGIDNDCNGLIDEAGPRSCNDDNPYTKDRYKVNKDLCTHALLPTLDRDRDTHVGAWVGGPDCNDGNPNVYPGAPEVADGVDSDCDGLDVPQQPPIETGVRTIEGVGPPPNCPPSATCTPVVVDCLGLPSARAYIAWSEPTAPTRGVITMFLGSEGTGFYDGEDVFVPSLMDEGFALARINWQDGWNNLIPHGPYGLSTAACRTATLVEHIYETEYVPLDLSPATAVCGFCVTGNSAGGLQAGYLLSEYGLETILDAVVLGGGPIPARVAEACLQANEDSTYGINRPSVVDYAYGIPKGQQGPCAQKDPTMEETWRADSLVDGGNDYTHPDTRVAILIGGLDHTSAPGHATAYYDRLVAEGTPMASYEVIPTAGHGLSVFLTDPAAQEAITEEFLWAPPAG